MQIFHKIQANRPLLFVSLITLSLLVIIIISEILGWPFLRKPFEQFVESKLERPVKIESPFKLRLIGGVRIKADNLWIAAPSGFAEPYLVNAKKVSLKLRYSDLWNIKPGEPYSIESIQAERITTYLNRHLDGKSTWQFSKDESDPIRPFPIIRKLILRHGQAKVDDKLTKSDLLIVFSTSEGKKNTLPISKVTAKGHFRERLLESELTTNGFLPIASQYEKSSQVASNGWLTYGKMLLRFKGSIYDLFGKQNVKGDLTVSGPSLGTLGDLLSVTLPRTSPFKIHGNIEKNDIGWLVNVTSARIGQSDLSGTFKYDTRPDKSVLSGTLKGRRLILADLAPAFGSTEEREDRVFPDEPLDFATYNRMNADIKIDIDYVDLGKAFREPIMPFKANLDLNKNKLSLAKIYAKTAQGTIAGNIFINAHKQKVSDPKQQQKDDRFKADWGIDVSAKNINLSKWLQVSETRKKKTKEDKKPTASEAYITGLLNARAQFKGKGNTTAELLDSLNGNLSMYIQNGEISHLIVEAVGLDIAQATGLLIGGDEHLKMQCAVADFKANDGVLESKVALVDTKVTTVLLDGDVDMGEEKLNLRLSAEPKNFSPLTVRSPIKITGTFLNPKISPKPEPIAARVAGSVLLAFINPFAAILPFLDPGKSKGSKEIAPCAETLNHLKLNIKNRHP